MRMISGKRSLFTSWLISYAVILVLPIVLSFTVYFISVQVITEKITTSNEILQKQLTQVLDDKIGDADILRRQIIANDSLESFLMSNQPYSSQQRYNIYLMLQDFANYMGINQVVKDFYVYVHGTEDIITASALYSRDLIYEQYHSGDEMQLDEWFAYLRQYHQRTLRVIRDQDDSGMIMMICSIPNLPSYSSKATLVMFINADSLLSSIEEMPFAHGTTMMLLDDNDTVILSNREATVTDPIRYERLSTQPDVFTSSVEGEKTLVLQSTSSSTKWKYVTLVSVDSIVADIRPIQFSTLVYLAVSLMIGGAVAYRFARKRYQPIDRILKRIGVPASPTGNEYDCIEQNIDRILKSSERLEAMFQRQRESVQNSYITSLIQGNIQSLLSGNETLLSVLGFRFESDLFAVAVLGSDSEATTVQAVDDELRRLLSPDSSVYTVDLGDQHIVMVNLPPGSERTVAFNELVRCIRTAAGRMGDRESQGDIGVSQVYQGLDMIPIAYSEAVNLLASGDEEGSPVITEDSSGRPQDWGCFFTPQQEKTLTAALNAGSAADVSKILDTIYDTGFAGGHQSLNMSRCLAMNIAGTAVKAVKGSEAADRAILRRIDHYIGKIWYCRTTEDMMGVLGAMLTDIAGQIGISGKETPRHLLDDIIRCVHENYSDPNFNVSRLADILSMNLSYISKFFKNNAGIGLHMYINQVRINRAKELLSEDGANIGSVLHQVGFENTSSFIRVFKKFVGTTPGVYKDQ